MAQNEGLYDNATHLTPYIAGKVHALKGLNHIADIRTMGLIAAIELELRIQAPFNRILKMLQPGNFYYFPGWS